MPGSWIMGSREVVSLLGCDVFFAIEGVQDFMDFQWYVVLDVRFQFLVIFGVRELTLGFQEVLFVHDDDFGSLVRCFLL